MKSDKDFFTFLKGMLRTKRVWIFVLIFLIILMLIILPSSCEEEETGQEGGNKTEERIEELCSSVEGVGECRVMVIFEDNKSENEEGRVYSVAVICEGADNINVRARITSLITSLYGIGSNRVSVIKLEK